MTNLLLGGAALATLVAFVPATAQVAQAPTAQRAPMMQVQTRAQVGAEVAAMFQRLDTNRDGFVTRAESQVGKGMRGDRQARKMERRNRSPEQRLANRAAAFDRIDTNRDGVLSRDEFARTRTVRQQRMGAGGAGQRMGQRGAAMRGMAALRGHMFDMADANRDARVSLQEATAAAYRHFDMADANRDGQLTRDERMQVRQQMRMQRRPG